MELKRFNHINQIKAVHIGKLKFPCEAFMPKIQKKLAFLLALVLIILFFAMFVNVQAFYADNIIGQIISIDGNEITYEPGIAITNGASPEWAVYGTSVLSLNDGVVSVSSREGSNHGLRYNYAALESNKTYLVTAGFMLAEDADSTLVQVKFQQANSTFNKAKGVVTDSIDLIPGQWVYVYDIVTVAEDTEVSTHASYPERVERGLHMFFNVPAAGGKYGNYSVKDISVVEITNNQNLLINNEYHSFEGEYAQTLEGTNKGTSRQTVETLAYRGRKSLEITTDGKATQTAPDLSFVGVNEDEIVAGEEYIVSCYAKTSPGLENNLKIIVSDIYTDNILNHNEVCVDILKCSAKTVDDKWTKITGYFSLKENTGFSLSSSNRGVGIGVFADTAGVYYVDDIEIRKAEPLNSDGKYKGVLGVNKAGGVELDVYTSVETPISFIAARYENGRLMDVKNTSSILLPDGSHTLTLDGVTVDYMMFIWNDEFIPLRKSFGLSEVNYTDTNLIKDGSFDDASAASEWTYILRTAATQGAQSNPIGTVSYITDDGYYNDGCVLYDVEYSGSGTVNALELRTNIYKPINQGKIYCLSFYAKLDGVDSLKVHEVKLHNPKDVSNIYTVNESVTLTGTGWRQYHLYLMSNNSASISTLRLWAGGDNQYNFKLYLDDFRLEELKAYSIDVSCQPGFEEIVTLSGDGSYARGEEVVLKAGVKPGYDYLFDAWTDSYGNAVEQSSVFVQEAGIDKSFTANFKPYTVTDKGFAVSQRGNLPVVASSALVVNGDNAVMEANVSVPDGHSVVDCGGIFYDGSYVDNFNIFTEGATVVPAASIGSDGDFSVTYNGIDSKSKLLSRAYLICRDEQMNTYVLYSDTTITLPSESVEKTSYKLIYNHELLLSFTGQPEPNSDFHKGFISELADTDVDAVTFCPQLYRTYAWDSEVDTTLRESVHPDVTSSFVSLDRAKAYILGGGDVVQETLDACREHDKDIIGSFRMNDHHYTTDKGWATHNYFWREHPEYWLYDSNLNLWQRLFNYMHPEVRDFYYSIIEEFCTKYDVDGVELDFQRSLLYFYPDEVERGKEVMTGFVGKVRAFLDRIGEERGKYLKLCVRIPQTIKGCEEAGLDVVTWDKLGFIDIVNISRGDEHSLEMGVEEFKSNLENAKVNVEMSWLTYQLLPMQRFTTVENYYAAAYNLLARGADGLSAFNIGWLREDKTPVIDALNGITDVEVLKTKEKHYVISNGQGTFPAKTDKEFSLVVPDDTSSGIFNSSLFRVEMEKDCTAETIEVYINDVKLEETTRTDAELFAKVKENDTGYAELNQVKFYKVPLDVLKPGDNKFYIKVMSQDEAGQILSAELALYH